MIAGPNARAAALMVLGVTAFCLNDAVVKHLTVRVPIGEIMVVRSCWMVVLLPLVLPRLGMRLDLPDRWAVARALSEVGVTFAFLTALAVLPLGDTYTLYFAAPIMLTLAAALTGQERVGRRRWAAVVAGFVGVLFVLGLPSGWQVATLLPLLAAALSVLRDLATRRVAQGIGAGTVAMTTAVMVGLSGLLTLPGGWAPLDLAAVFWCLVAAAGAASGYVLFVAGLRLGELSYVAPFRYAAIPVAILLDVLIWRVTPTAGMVIGATIIIASGLFIFFREQTLARDDGAGATAQGAAPGAVVPGSGRKGRSEP